MSALPRRCLSPEIRLSTRERAMLSISISVGVALGEGSRSNFKQPSSIRYYWQQSVGDFRPCRHPQTPTDTQESLPPDKTPALNFNIISVCVCMCVYVCVRVCACVCV